MDNKWEASNPNSTNIQLFLQNIIPPTEEEVMKTEGKKLSEDDLSKLVNSESIQAGFTVEMNPVLHKLKYEEKEYYVLMVDRPCSCIQMNGPNDECKKHQKKLTKKRAKDQEKLHSENTIAIDSKKNLKLFGNFDGDENSIASCLTADFICALGPAGTPILIPIETTNNEYVGPKAVKDDFKDSMAISGILVKGVHDCPQFIPKCKIPQYNKISKTNSTYLNGQLVLTRKGTTIMYPEDIPINYDGFPNYAVFNNINKFRGLCAGTLKTREDCVPEFYMIDATNPAPIDNHVPVGVLVKTKDDGILFVQTSGIAFGSENESLSHPTAKEGTPGFILGEIIIKNGKPQAVPKGSVDASIVVGHIIQGEFNQPLVIAIQGKELDTGNVATVNENEAKTMKLENWLDLVKRQQNCELATKPYHMMKPQSVDNACRIRTMPTFNNNNSVFFEVDDSDMNTRSSYFKAPNEPAQAKKKPKF